MLIKVDKKSHINKKNTLL